MASLDDYIRQMRSYGYRNEDIRSRLIASGYSERDIAHALEQSSFVSVKSVFLVVLTCAVLVSVLVVVWLFFSSPPELALSAVVDDRVWRAGEDLSVRVNVKSSRSQDVRVVAEVVSADSGALQAVKGVSLVGVRESETVIVVPLPERLLAGDYLVRVAVKGSSGSVGDSVRFSVGIPVDESSVGPFVPDVPVEPALVEVEEPVVPEPVVPVVESDLVSVDDIAATAVSDVDRAVSLCRKHSSSDRCFKAVAVASRSASVCDLVSDVLRRDDCYSVFALDGDFSVCPKISSTGLRKACEDLKRFNEENP